MLIEAVETDSALSMLVQASCNSRAKMAAFTARRAHETHAVARQFGITPIHTPVCSPQSNGMAGSFVNTLTHDYVSQANRSTGAIILAQKPDAFTHFNKVHPHSALKLKSPRMYRRDLARQAFENDAHSALTRVRLCSGKIISFIVFETFVAPKTSSTASKRCMGLVSAKLATSKIQLRP